MFAPSSSVSTISWTGSILSDKLCKLISEDDGRNISKFQSKPWEAFTQVNRRGEPSLVPRSNTECSTLRTLELKREGRLEWERYTTFDDEDDDDGITGEGFSDSEGEDDVSSIPAATTTAAVDDDEDDDDDDVDEDEEDGDAVENRLSRPTFRGMEIAVDAMAILITDTSTLLSLGWRKVASWPVIHRCYWSYNVYKYIIISDDQGRDASNWEDKVRQQNVSS